MPGSHRGCTQGRVRTEAIVVGRLYSYQESEVTQDGPWFLQEDVIACLSNSMGCQGTGTL